MNYVNAARAREAVMALSTVLKQSLWQRILASPFVAVMVDESTDISTSENMILYVTYIYEGRAQCSFVGLVHAPEVDAESLHDQLVTFLESHSLSMKKVMVFCSDGASVMTGDKSGVAVCLQEHNRFMLRIHCIAHRLALGCADAASDMDYPEWQEKTMNENSSYFNRSGKRTSALKALCKEMSVTITKIVKSGKTRWLSRSGCVVALLKLFPVIAQVFAIDDENDVVIVL
jgi:hypothetical protein